jgi:glycosyltransferase involved in cell wall biosynthesis
VRFLFVHQNFPGQYLHIVRHLAASGQHEVVFVSQPNDNVISGVRRVFYHKPDLPEGWNGHPNLREHDLAFRRADAVGKVARNLKGLGFVPDIVIGHHGWGEMLHLADLWPGVPMLGYFEYYYSPTGQDVGFDPEFPSEPGALERIRAMNVVNLLALALDQHGHTPTDWQRTRYPEWARGGIEMLSEGAELATCRPDPKAHAKTLSIGDFRITPKDRLVTYVARNLEPYRGFHTMMRALPDLLRNRPDAKVVIVGGDDVSYGARLADSTWKAHFQREMAGRYDSARVLMPGHVPYDIYLSLLQRSDAHVYLTYPFVASWSLREAMAMGCAIIGAEVDPVREFITHRRTGLLTPALDPQRLSETIQLMLEDTALATRLRKAARRHAEKHLDMKLHIAAFTKRIETLTGQEL